MDGGPHRQCVAANDEAGGTDAGRVGKHFREIMEHALGNVMLLDETLRRQVAESPLSGMQHGSQLILHPPSGVGQQATAVGFLELFDDGIEAGVHSYVFTAVASEVLDAERPVTARSGCL